MRITWRISVVAYSVSYVVVGAPLPAFMVGIFKNLLQRSDLSTIINLIINRLPHRPYCIFRLKTH